jgi:hypothetical protein
MYKKLCQGGTQEHVPTEALQKFTVVEQEIQNAWKICSLDLSILQVLQQRPQILELGLASIL